jgi:hypothetical protein
MPIHLISLSSSNASSVGLKFIDLAPTGWMVMFNFDPIGRPPSIEMMNGFHSGYRLKSCSTFHTSSALVDMSIDVLIS